MLLTRVNSIVAAACLFVVGWKTTGERRSFAHLIAARDSTPVSIWFVFRPADCRLGSDAIETMNALARARRVSVHGVLLEPPPTDGEAQALIKALGVRFSVQFDRDRMWREAIEQQQLSNPVLVVRTPRELVGIVTRDLAPELRRLQLTTAVDAEPQ